MVSKGVLGLNLELIHFKKLEKGLHLCFESSPSYCQAVRTGCMDLWFLLSDKISSLLGELPLVNPDVLTGS